MHIKTQREIFRQIAGKYCDDVYDFLQLAQGWREWFLHNLEMEFINKQEEELSKYINAWMSWLSIREDLEKRFIFRVEKNRGRPLDMGEINDIYEAIEYWAKNNGYGYLFDN